MLTIGVVAYNNPEETIAFAHHLTALTSVAYQLRIWDNSEDGQVMQAMRAHPELAVCAGGEGNLGFGAGHNRLFEQSTGAYYLISNADVEYTQSCIPTLMAHLDERSDVGIAAPRLLNDDGTVQLSCRTFYTPFLAAVRRPPLKWLFGDDHRVVRNHLMAGADHTRTFAVDWALGAVLLVRRDALKRAFLFDPRYFLYFEDVDLCRHIAETGQKTLFCGDAVAVHAHHRASAGSLLSRASRWHAASMVKYFLKRHQVPAAVA